MKEIIDEGIRRHDKYAVHPEIDSAFCNTAINFVLTQINRNLSIFSDHFPSPASKNLKYSPIGNTEWTSSFWTGMLWLAYEWSGDKKYRLTAEKSLASYQKRLDDRKYTNTHDLGFLYTLSCVAAYKITGDQTAKQTALQAADLLITRYFDKAGIIQAWGDLNDPEQRGRMIIDCCMNLPLLYWAGEVTGEKKYAKIAATHASQAAKYIVRSDASTFHTFYMDVTTGQPRFGKSAQGFADNSCWSRGQAWGVYGFTLSYVYTGDWKFVELAKKLANYFLNRLPEDDICYWDLCFTEGEEERDSSAAAIFVCGLIELSKQLPLTDPYRVCYENAALRIIHSLTKDYTTEGIESNGILLHGVYGKPWNEGIDECLIWGDYFYFEALIRLVKDWKLYW